MKANAAHADVLAPRSARPAATLRRAASSCELRLSLSRALYRRVSRLLGPIFFSTTFDDHRMLEEAAIVQPGDSILCIASAGDTPLNLLRFGPGHLVAIDLDEAQLHLSILKAAAVGMLDAASVRGFLGAESYVEPRGFTYGRLRRHLPEPTRLFWDGHLRLIERGVLTQGSAHKIFAPARTALRVVDLVADRMSPGRREFINPYVDPLLHGRFPNYGALQPYLNGASHAAIQDNLDRMHFCADDLRLCLKSLPAKSVDVFVLSNVVDWMPPRDVRALLYDVVRVARNDARIVSFSRRRRFHLPAELVGALRVLPEVEARARALDRVKYYRVCRVMRVDKEGSPHLRVVQ